MKFCCFVVGLCIVLASCGKDENSEPTKTDLITSASWKYNDGGVDLDHNGAIDLAFGTGAIPDCMVDNTGTFRVDGTGTNDEGATKCNSTDPQSTTFNWAFQNSETVLNITGSGVLGITGQFKVLDLTSTKLSLSRDTTMTGVGSVALIVNLKH